MHETRRLATGVEAEGSSKPYEFGDALNLDVPATLLSAVAREGAGLPLAVDHEDLRVHRSVRRSNCASALLLDCSHSMGLDRRIVRGAFREVAACRKAGIAIHTFMPARDPALVAFVRKMAEIARGKAYFTSTLTLGQYILLDCVRRRTRRVR